MVIIETSGVGPSLEAIFSASLEASASRFSEALETTSSIFSSGLIYTGSVVGLFLAHSNAMKTEENATTRGDPQPQYFFSTSAYLILALSVAVIGLARLNFFKAKK